VVLLAILAIALLVATMAETTLAYRRRNEWRRVQRARKRED
jgi:hypothetical protein